MSKFTFFTIFFSLIVIVIVGQLVLRDALFPSEYKSQVLTQEEQEEEVSEEEKEETENKAVSEEKNTQEEFLVDVPPEKTGGISDHLINQAGFLSVKITPFSGKLFELFDFGTLEPSRLTSYQVEEDGPVGIFTEIEFPDEIKAQELYSLLQNKTKVYIDLKVNETNTFGDRSFFLNHRKKPDEAFLVIRMRNFVYGFAYIKTYHPRIKTLISFLYTAILDQQTTSSEGLR